MKKCSKQNVNILLQEDTVFSSVKLYERCILNKNDSVVTVFIVGVCKALGFEHWMLASGLLILRAKWELKYSENFFLLLACKDCD